MQALFMNTAQQSMVQYKKTICVCKCLSDC